MSNKWRHGTPPKNGKKYEMRQRMRMNGCPWQTIQLIDCGWWDGKFFVEPNQFSGGTRVILGVNRWRP